MPSSLRCRRDWKSAVSGKEASANADPMFIIFAQKMDSENRKKKFTQKKRNLPKLPDIFLPQTAEKVKIPSWTAEGRRWKANCQI